MTDTRKPFHAELHEYLLGLNAVVVTNEFLFRAERNAREVIRLNDYIDGTLWPEIHRARDDRDAALKQLEQLQPALSWTVTLPWKPQVLGENLFVHPKLAGGQ